MSACKSCGAEIIWARTANGKAMPLDALPALTGNIALLRNGVAHYVTPDANAVENRYVSHFATCPQAGKHRAKR